MCSALRKRCVTPINTFPTSSSIQRPQSATRQLKILVVVLLFSNIAVGLLAVFALRRADRRYSELIETTVPVLNELQTLTARASRAMVATNPTRFQTGDQGALEAAKQGVEEDARMRQKLQAMSWLSDDMPRRRALDAAGDEFTARAEAVLGAFARGDLAKASAEREATLRPAFERYLDAITTASDELEAEGERANAAATQHIGVLTKLVLGAAGWPLILLGSLLILTALFVLALMILFRGREMEP